LNIARQIMAGLPRIEAPRTRTLSPVVATRLVTERISQAAALLPSVDDLVVTAASYEPPPITLDVAFEELDNYRRASLFAHKGPEKPDEAPKPPKAPPKPPEPVKAPETPSPTIKRSFGGRR
jgi:hypothetical protein